MKNKQQEYEEITTRLNPSNRPQHKPEKTQSKLLKFHTDLSIHKRNSSVSSPATPGTGKK